MPNKDYVFHINWEDRYKQLYRVGFLAQLDESYYIVIKNKSDAKGAYDSGFIGVPGFKVEEIYKSDELFDFFKSRILQKSNSNPCEELAETGAKSMVDSYSLKKVSDKLSIRYKTIILDAYELQEKKKKIEVEKNINETVKDTKKSSPDESFDK